MNYELPDCAGRQIKKRKNAGYTIIETMIAVSLFIIIVMAGMAALLNANVLHRKSQDMRSIIDNLSFVMEDMSRNIRTGYNYHCLNAKSGSSLTVASVSNPQDCDVGWGIGFETAEGDVSNHDDQWVYYIDSGKIFKSVDGPSNFSNFVQMTPDEVFIDGTLSEFDVLGSEPPLNGDYNQPFVTIKLVGSIKYKEDVVTPFTLQTSVSQRAIDI